VGEFNGEFGIQEYGVAGAFLLGGIEVFRCPALRVGRDRLGGGFKALS
jgi:hypothetical protein